MILPACNTEAMNLHLAEIAKTVAPGAHAVLLLDQAGWHLSARLVVPANITIIPLPPKCPELNPVENIWQYMRDNWLSNRVFKSYDDIVDHCCYAWNTLLDRPWKIMSIGLRQWAHTRCPCSSCQCSGLPWGRSAAGAATTPLPQAAPCLCRSDLPRQSARNRALPLRTVDD